jgi:hypothetical protein
MHIPKKCYASLHFVLTLNYRGVTNLVGGLHMPNVLGIKFLAEGATGKPLA